MRQLKISKSITNRDTTSLDKYLHDIAKEELITAEDEVKLAQKIRAGDDKALEKLCKANLRFVISVAKQYQNQGLSLSDLINEGNLGLLKATRRFDETRGFKFISYAVWWIRQSILQAIAEQSRIIRLPLNQVGAIHKISKEISKLEQKFERHPSVDEIAQSLETSGKKIREVLSIGAKHISIDAPLIQGEDISMLDVFANPDIPDTDDNMIYESLSKEIHRSLSTLDEKEREVIILFYGIGISHNYMLDEIASKLNLTPERVRQIKEKALHCLKHNSRNRLLKSYLGK